ncbi:hypothetical protein [Amycolatopsis sp. NPDC102389]|uniref:hypothetical protein n=1 Tax=Amycolatopsis sp. NPDC102389 TaxID=3363941 RepID=UPI0037F404B5
MQEVRKLRGEMQRLTKAELQHGVDAGLFRKVGARVTALQLFGSVQWMWVWFDPVFLGGLLLDRYGSPQVADPKGAVGAVGRDCLTAAGRVPNSSSWAGQARQNLFRGLLTRRGRVGE